MDNLMYLVESQWFKMITSVFALLTLMLAAGLLAICIVEYGKGFDRYREGKKSDPWFIVVSTLRDTFTVGALYLVVDLLRSAIAYRANPIQPTLMGYLSLFSPFIELAIYCLMVFITFRRLFILRRWLDVQNAK